MEQVASVAVFPEKPGGLLVLLDHARQKMQVNHGKSATHVFVDFGMTFGVLRAIFTLVFTMFSMISMFSFSL